MRTFIVILSIFICFQAGLAARDINAWGLSMFGSLSPEPLPLSSGECGTQTAVVDPHVLFGSPLNYETIACGGKVYYWNATHMYGMGSNYGGSLGTGVFGGTDTRCAGAQEVSAFRNQGEEIAGMACNRATFVAWTKSGKVYGWGSNQYKQLGPIVAALANPTLLPMPVSNITKVVIGAKHVLARTGASEVVCWGTNRQRQCGTLLGDSIWPPVKLVFGLSGIADIAVGSDHSLVLTGAGTVFGFGFNHYGQVCKTSNTLRSETPSVISTSPIVGDAFYGRPIRAIAANGDGSFFLNDEGRLFGCGKHSGMGWGMVSPYVDRPREILVLPTDELGSSMAVSKIFASHTAYHTLALTKDLRLLGAGANTAGELALGGDVLRQKEFAPLLGGSLAPVVAVSVAGYQSLVTTNTDTPRPSPQILPPQCQIQGCTCPKPLDDAICVGGKWTAPNAIIWVNTTISVNVELVGNLTLAPGGSLSMPFGEHLIVKGCTQFFGGVINFTATPEQLLQFSESPLLFVNTTCGDGKPEILLTITGNQDPCQAVSIRSIEQGPEGFYILFNRATCKKPIRFWIIGAVIGGIAALIIIVLIVAFFVKPVRHIIFPFYRRQVSEESRALNAKQSGVSSPGNSEPNSPRASYQVV
jgi:hypothetical protein